MIDLTDLQIESAVRRFRAAIDQAGQEPWRQKNMVFPRGCCGHASELLGRFLIDNLGITPDYVNEVAHENLGGWQHSHAWLEWSGLVIDITGDQFGWEPVIVTREPEFHGKGDPQTKHAVCLDHQRNWWLQECGSLWNAISKFL